MKHQPTEEQILAALKNIIDPDLNRDIVSLGFVKNVSIQGSKVRIQMELTTPACPVKERFKAWAEEYVSRVPGVETVQVDFSAKVQPQAKKLGDIRSIIAVASGKGGVGKSMVAANLACSLAKQGARCGLLDADIYGPSLPRMFGLMKEKPKVKDSKILPLFRYGLSLMSIGFFVEESQAIIWRGPMVAGALSQLLFDVQWGELDYLVIDLPPGTGDAQLTLVQKVPVSGAVIVTTPQELSLTDARKAVTMFRKVHVPILGIVENMSIFQCPHCSEETLVFAGEGARKLAEEAGAPLLERLPLDPELCASADRGVPFVLARPDTKTASRLERVAGEVARRLSILARRHIPLQAESNA